jgi:hypothetical protein
MSTKTVASLALPFTAFGFVLGLLLPPTAGVIVAALLATAGLLTSRTLERPAKTAGQLATASVTGAVLISTAHIAGVLTGGMAVLSLLLVASVLVGVRKLASAPAPAADTTA